MDRAPLDGTHGRPGLRVIAAAAVLLLAGVTACRAGGLTEPQKRGRRIYIEGVGRKPVHAIHPSPGIRSPGSAFPCASCHLADGSGQLEGGVRSADITPLNLTKDYAGSRPSGRSHPAYTGETIKTAVTSGLDPAGNELDPAHPRYEMAPEDLEDLVAYLSILGQEPVPGVTDNEVRVGMLLPTRGPLAEAAMGAKALLDGYFSHLNSRGGSFTRRVTLVPVPFDPGRQGSAAEAVRGPVEREELFCFLANVGTAPGNETAVFLSDRKVPVIVPLLVAPEGGYGTDRYTFHVYASVRDQARVMVDFLAEKTGKAGLRIGIVHAAEPSGEAGAAGAREQAKRRGAVIAAEEIFTPRTFSAPDAVRRLSGASPDGLLFFGSGDEALALLSEAGKRGWRPLFLAPASMTAGSLTASPIDLPGTVYLASPFETAGPSSPGMALFTSLSEALRVPGKHRAFQRLAFAGALLLEEGLRRSGRAVTREKFVEAVGNLRMFETGVTPPLTYTPNRRVGAAGAAILSVDPASRRMSVVVPWREPD